jgi:hypothetical protein
VALSGSLRRQGLAVSGHATLREIVEDWGIDTRFYAIPRQSAGNRIETQAIFHLTPGGEMHARRKVAVGRPSWNHCIDNTISLC